MTSSTVARPDIEGLRAVAVLVVLAYHAFPTVVPGGFVGVDVFFVISGFLITRLVVDGLRRGDFGFADFYARRIRRLFPALALVLAATLALGWWLSFPDEYRQIGQHVAAAATFTSNIVLRREVGYFDNAAETKPLLHLWSLAIEEQFYLAWPLLVAGLWRLGWLRVAVPVLAIASFAYALSIVTDDATLAFYSPLARGWELLLGACLALGARRWPVVRGQGAVGFALIVASAVGFDRTTPWPGACALVPTLGTVLVLAAGPAGLVGRTLMAKPLLVGIGRISYPLYLWHWPLLSFAFVAQAGDPSVASRVGLLALSIALAWLTWRWIERPIRNAPRLARIPVALVVVVASLGVAGVVVMRMDGLSQRFGPVASYLDWFDNARPAMRYDAREHVGVAVAEECDFYDNEGWRLSAPSVLPKATLADHCVTRPSGATRAVMLWGDSHAARLRTGLVATLAPDVALLQVTTSGCAPSLSRADTARPFCVHANRVALETIAREKPDLVMIAERDGYRLPELRELAIEVRRLGVQRVLVVGPAPQWRPELYKTIASTYWARTPTRLDHHLDRRIVELESTLKAQLRPDEPFEFVDLFDFLCDREGCLVSVDGDRQQGLTTYDYGHLSARASLYVGVHLLGPLIDHAKNPSR